MALLSSSGLNATPTTSLQTGVGTGAQPYAADVMSKGQALVNNPAPAYTGQLTAGQSDLQGEAWKGLSNLTLPSTLTTSGQNLLDVGQKAQSVGYSPVGSTFDAGQAQQYMNPYLMQGLAPQLEEARRQAMITQMANNAKATSQGAFGGTRQALMDTETQRNLGTNLANITGQGYSTAYDKAMAQFNADQARKVQEAQYGTDVGLKGLQAATSANQAAGNIGAQQAQYGLQNLTALATAGNTQQAQEQAGLNALYNQYLDQRSQPWTQLQNQANLVKGLGGTTQNTFNAQQSELQKLAGSSALTASLVKNMTASGMAPSDIIAALKSMGVSQAGTGTDAGLNYPVDYGTAGGNIADNTLTYDPKSPTGYVNNSGQVVDGNGTVIGTDAGTIGGTTYDPNKEYDDYGNEI